ncbi:toxin HicA [Corynebacterium sp. p3-SID1194]|nr:toxin HicA [Corynebacterium sp. p3-SID1194]
MGSSIEEILRKMRSNPSNIRFTELKKVCNHHFGEPRNRGSSHFIYKTPWPGDPRVNIQNKGGAAKPYQVRQVLSAIDHLRENSHER